MVGGSFRGVGGLSKGRFSHLTPERSDDGVCIGVAGLGNGGGATPGKGEVGAHS